jgi:HpcH/HpaI aldolase/citrate lyase family
MMIDLMLFENSVPGSLAAMRYGISNFLVDWEVLGKAQRQDSYDTEIRPGTVADVEQMSALAGATVWCRINHYGSHTAAEVNAAIKAGASGVLLPMVRSADEVAEFLRLVGLRCRTGILIETEEAYRASHEIAKLPIDSVYFGLNDFAISRGGGSIFKAVADGSVAAIRNVFAGHRFGFGGLTAMDAGDPIPSRLLLAEMSRLDCHFTFLRRSFRKDIQTRDPAAVVRGITAMWTQCRNRRPEEVQRDRQELESLIHNVRTS